MVAIGHGDEVVQPATVLQCLGKIFALAIGHHRVGIAMNNEEHRVFAVDI